MHLVRCRTYSRGQYKLEHLIRQFSPSEAATSSPISQFSRRSKQWDLDIHVHKTILKKRKKLVSAFKTLQGLFQLILTAAVRAQQRGHHNGGRRDVGASVNSSPECTRVLLTRVATSEQGREGYAAQNKRAARVREPLTLVVARLVFLETAIGRERQTAQHLASSNAPDDGPAWNVRCHTPRRHNSADVRRTSLQPTSKAPLTRNTLRRTDASCPFRLEERWVLEAASKSAHSWTTGKNSTRFEVVVSTDEYGLDIRSFSSESNAIDLKRSGDGRRVSEF